MGQDIRQNDEVVRDGEMHTKQTKTHAHAHGEVYIQFRNRLSAAACWCSASALLFQIVAPTLLALSTNRYHCIENYAVCPSTRL